jgi:hypothetical protein
MLASESGDLAGDGKAHSPFALVGSRSLTRSLKPEGDVESTGMDGGSRIRS